MLQTSCLNQCKNRAPQAREGEREKGLKSFHSLFVLDNNKDRTHCILWQNFSVTRKNCQMSIKVAQK